MLAKFGPNIETVEKFLHHYDPLACLFIQALDMHLQMPLIPGCMYKNPRALECSHTECNNLSWFLNYTLNLAFTLYTLDIRDTRLRMGHNS